MKGMQILLFVVLAGAATAGLMTFAGDWDGAKPTDRNVAPSEPSSDAPAKPDDKPSIRIPNRGSITQLEGVFIQAPPEYFVWEDPDTPGDTVEISGFYAWSLRAETVEPLTRGEGDRIGALCTKVIFETYRRPQTHVEALALARQDKGAQAGVLERRITGDEARVYGRMVPQLLRDKKKDAKMRLANDSEIRFSKDLVIFDKGEGLTITGEEITAYPKLGTASGKKKFTLKHAAFEITGLGIKLHKIRDGRTLAEIGKNATLQLLEDTRAAGGQSVLGGGEFRKAWVNAEGGAIVRRDELSAGERLRIEMFDHVHLEQEGGRSLDAQRVTMIAIRDVDPRAKTKARSGGWRLRRLEADGGVKLKETHTKDDGRTTVLKADSDTLTHDVPAAGAPTTLFEGKTLVSFEGDIPLDGRSREGGLIRIISQDRMWIGPVADRAVPDGIPADALRRVLMQGGSRIERHGKGRVLEEDVLEGDEVEVVFFSDPLTGDAPKGAIERQTEMGRVTALEFTAKGDVRLGGTRVNGNTDLLVAKGLAGERPRISAIGKGTKLRFPEIRTNQRLVGRDKPASEGAPGAPATPAKDDPKGSWQLHRLAATGNVDVVTTLGGPSLGAATHMTGARLTYEDLSNLARLEGTAGNPALITADSLANEPNMIRAQTLSLDRRRGIVNAKGAVRGELWTTRKGLGGSNMRDTIRRQDPAPAQVLEVETDQRIDVDIVRTDPRGGIRYDTEQVVNIHGPLTAELRSERMLVDRLRAEHLELALVLATKPQDNGGGLRLPAGKAAGRPSGMSPKAPVVQQSELMRIDIEAGEITAEMGQGVTNRIVAQGGVTLSAEMGEATGSRIVYDGRARTVDVSGDSSRRADVWFASEGGHRNEVTAQKFLLTLGERSIERIQAQPRSGERVVARVFSRDKAKPQNVETYDIWADGGIEILPTVLRATTVVADRRMSRDGGRTWSEPARLWSPALRVEGQNLLAAEGSSAPREIRQVIAEGDNTTIESGKDRDLVRIWGQRIVLDVKAEKATVTGTTAKPVRLQKGVGGSEVDGLWPEATLNLRTGLPSMRGSKITLHPRTDRDK